MKKDKEIISEIIKLFKPYRWKVIIMILSIIVSSSLSILTPIINQKLMDDGLISGNIDKIVRYSIYTLLLTLFIQAIGIVETKYRAYIENMIAFNLEKKAMRHILKMKLSFFNDKNYATIMSNLKTDIDKISGLCDRSTFYILTSIFRIIVGIVGLILVSWKLCILVIVVIPIRYVIVKSLSNKREDLFYKYINMQEDYSEWQGDTFAGIKEVKSCVLEDLKMKQLFTKQRNIIKQDIKLAYLEKGNEISETLFNSIITTLLYIIGGYLVVGQTLSVGRLFAFITYSSYVIDPIFSIMNLRYTISGIIPSAKRYFEFLDTEIEEDVKLKKPIRLEQNNVWGNIEFKDVFFSYKSHKEEKLTLKGINFKINAGENVAIIGRNGVGKTTIINLILRFLNPCSGHIFLDGKDISLIKLKDYRKMIAVVTQEIYLFNTTIKENILLNSKTTEEKLSEVSQRCGIDKIIKDMPNNYESIVGERGSKLSGGERQKIAMARALTRNSKILILDEATANYDIKSEQEISEIIKNTYKDKTTIIITHKPEILKGMDKIIVINDGKVEDVGSNQELYNRNEFYREMVDKDYEKIV